MVEIRGARALVTGGARRIGRALVEGLAAEGARVAIHCHTSADEAEALAAACPGSVVLRADLADPAARDGLVARAVEALGGLDILVNNASTYVRTDLEDIDAHAWDRALAVNLTAPFFLARDAGLHMRSSGGGVIVNLTDWAVDRPYPAYLPYFAAKGGLASATRGLARALAPEVRVNAVAPGPILLPEGASAAYEGEVVRATPLGRLGGADAIVAAVMFLIGNDFVTGSTLSVDGGRSLR
jgi:NAD(P)-dependent dehydrogenase (short-subunit alcohol dehydrogenase family)